MLLEQFLIQHFSEYVSPNRMQLFNNVLQYRTRYLTFVVEDIYQPHNASAVVRTCDCLGLQDLHVIENINAYQMNKDIALGASNWITMHRHNTPIQAVEALRQKGYRIIATMPHAHDTSLHDFDLQKGKVAFLFGNEQNGLSQELVQQAGEYVKIPMYGFTESFNISVSAAIVASNLTQRLHQSDIAWQLTEHDRSEILLDWFRISVKSSDLIERELINRYKEQYQK